MVAGATAIRTERAVGVVSVDGVLATSPLPLRPAGFLELDGMFERWDAAPAPDPRLVVLNEDLARELGLDVDELRSPAGRRGARSATGSATTS